MAQASSRGTGGLPGAVLERVRAICTALPGVVEEPAWTGIRWCVGGKNFAHVVAIRDGRPPAFARAAGHDGPLVVLTFRATEEDREALRHVGRPFFHPPWGSRWTPPVIGVALDDGTDWDDIEAWLVDSHRLLAPTRPQH
jgi:hypothetical protein